MLALQPIYQNPRDLRLLLWCGAPPSHLTVLRTASVLIGGWRLTFRVIGESHWISAQHGDAAPLHEVLACTEAPAPPDAHRHTFADLRGHTFRTDDARYNLRIAFALRKTPPALPKGGLGLTFPPVLGQTPFTHIAWRVAEGELRWRTRHLYPQPDGLIVVSSLSRLALAQPPAWGRT